MKTILILFLSIFTSTLFSQNDPSNYLVKVFEDEETETKSGYANLKGEIIIPLGKYTYCFTDTLKKFAIVVDKAGALQAIDRNGKELYQVKWYDNGPDYVSEGLFRIIIAGKTGYANEDGEIVIKPQFECTNPFRDGKAKVTYSCTLKKDGEYSLMESDEWFYIDRTGKKVE